ncbi:hypothetical protein K3495_g769 [Podosphaera aphanis]|nr:hypothetical protein K3495_g769 [Podosphaera aphanis]
MVNWHRSVRSFCSPPLKAPLNPTATPTVSLEDKRDVLSRNLLQSISEANDIPLDSTAVGCSALPFPDLTFLEVKTSIRGAGNTASGEDEIPTAILKKSWPPIKPLVFSLFKSCLQVGHHPACYKRALLVMLNKPNKLDKSNPRSFRPVALLSATARLRHLDPRHLLLRRANRVTFLNHPTSRFARHVLALPRTEQINLTALPYWTPREDREAAYARVGGPRGESKEMAKQAFNSFLATIPSGDIVLYIDGSKQSDGLTGASYVAYQGSVQIFQKSIPLGKGLEVFDAEAIGALDGAKSALASPTIEFGTNLWVFLDNLEVASCLFTPFSGSSQAVFDEFLKLESEWQCRFHLPHIRQGEVKVHWVPGHSSIPGNVAAEKAANEA